MNNKYYCFGVHIVNLSGIGITTRSLLPYFKVCSNFIHLLDPPLNSYIAFENPSLGIIFLVYPPINITPLPSGDVTIFDPTNLNGNFGPKNMICH